MDPLISIVVVGSIVLCGFGLLFALIMTIYSHAIVAIITVALPAISVIGYWS